MSEPMRPRSGPASDQPIVDPTTPSSGLGPGTGRQAANKAGAYGGAELGSMVGRAVGPPIIGGIVGNLVGERVGEKASRHTGLERVAGQINDDLAKTFGQRRADKVGDIALTSMGYSESERCLCCPCMPASQLLFFLFCFFFVFNVFRLGTGLEYDLGCSPSLGDNSSVTVRIPWNEDSNVTQDHWILLRNDSNTENLIYLDAYPCVFGFHYLVSGSVVWLVFLPFALCSTFGTCYRQCCCCLCDPIVCCATLSDLIKRCLCECGWFSCIDMIWYSMCVFQVIWAVYAGVWLGLTLIDPLRDFDSYDPNHRFIKTVIASIVLDLLIASSEILHKLRLLLCLPGPGPGPSPPPALQETELQAMSPNSRKDVFHEP